MPVSQMLSSMKHAVFSIILLLATCWSTAVHADIRVLIVDGFSNHSVEKTTQKIRDILSSDPVFKVSVASMPSVGSDEWKAWEPNFAASDVIIQTCNNIFNRQIVWPDRVKDELESYIRRGGGMYIYHSANNAFADWPEYNKMIGMGWRKVDFGKALHIKDGRVVEIPSGVGKKTSHGPRIDAVFHRFGDHPIHANLPRSWKSADVEVYSYTRGPVDDLTVLSYAREPVNDMDFPTEWVVEYGSGRTYTSTYGHYWRNQDNPPGVRDVAFQTLMMRALQWLAKKPVTQTVPVNFPTDSTTSLQDVPPRVASADSSAAQGFVYAGLVSNHIEIYSANAGTGALEKVGAQATSDVPFYLKIHPNKKHLYVGLRGKTHGIEAYAIDSKTGLLTLINEIGLEAGPVYMEIDRTGRYLFTAPWSAERVAMSRLADDGRLVDVNYFASGKRPHAFAIDPSNQFLYVPCLGVDIIQQHRFDASTGAVTQAEPFIMQAGEGTGPRLPVFHPANKVMYQGNEKNSTITVYNMNPDSGSLSSVQNISTVPDDFKGKSNLSELHLTPDGKFLYIANRGHNSITGYSVSSKDGTLSLIGFRSLPGKTIRSFSISSDGDYLYAADQRSVDITVLSVDPTSGVLSPSSVTEAGGGIGKIIAESL